MTKTIAFYLPQFHEIPENNEWWGNGFTEWTSVKAAKPLFKGHIQPKIPYKGRYYNLLDKDIMKWQASIAQKAGVFGFCFYHYWFKGKKLLEKPVENYLHCPDITQNYCFSWANESWIRTWSNLEGNDWNESIDKKNPKNGPSVLMKQDYGNESDWIEHFEYLLPFFKDRRYIKVDGKPMFLIYKIEKIQCINAMLECWNRLALENGLNGIYIVGTNSQKKVSKYMNANVLYEPAFTFSNDLPYLYKIRNSVMDKLNKIGYEHVRKYNYDIIWNKILNRKIKGSVITFSGAFVNYDDTPRRGVNGTLFTKVTPKKFGKYLKRLIERENNEGENYIFITAWNEWAEGAFLEPDAKNGYNFLSQIKSISIK